MMEKLIKLCVVLLVANLCLNAIISVDSAAVFYDKSRLTKREFNNSTICLPGNPCGWAVYDSDKGKHVINYFMRNTCNCPPDIKCIRTNEDLSTATFVYRCQYPDVTTEPDF